MFPAPVLHFTSKLPTNIKVYVFLVASNKDSELKEGFQYGETKTIRAGSDNVVLSGLQLYLY